MTIDLASSVAKAFTIAKRMGLAVDVVFTHVTSTHTPSTGTMSAPVTTTIPGVAVRDTGNPEVYQTLGLVELEPITLVFQASTRGARPPLGSTITWDGKARIVRSVEPVSPAGTDIMASIVVSS